jgi:hypothetical protein
VPRKAKPPFIEPAHLRAGFNTDGDALIWFAIWNPNRNFAIAIDISTDEIEPWRARAGNTLQVRSLRSSRQEPLRLRGWWLHLRGRRESKREVSREPGDLSSYK